MKKNKKNNDTVINEGAVVIRKSTWKKMLEAWQLYVLIALPVIYIIIFNYIPMGGIVIAFQNFNVVKGIFGSQWIGFENFQYLFTSVDFYKVLRNSLLISFYKLVWGFPIPIILAILLNEVRSVKFKKFSQTALYLPYFISWVVLASIITNFLSPKDGIFNHIRAAFGLEPIAFLQEPKFFRTVIVVAENWKGAGWGTIIYLAAVTGIDSQLYEAALIDGANRWQRIWHITLPGIKSTIIVMLIMRMGNVLKNGFEDIFLLLNTITLDVGEVFETYTYRIGLRGGRFSYSTAVGLFQSVVGFVMITLANKFSKKIGESSLY